MMLVIFRKSGNILWRLDYEGGQCLVVARLGWWAIYGGGFIMVVGNVWRRLIDGGSRWWQLR